MPNPPKTFDEMMAQAQALKDQGKTYEIGFTAAQYEGYVVNINNLINGYGGRSSTRTARLRRSTTRPCRRSPCCNKLATSGLTSPSLSNAQEPEVFADLQNGRSAFSLNWPYVLVRDARGQPGPGATTSGTPRIPTVDRRRRPRRPSAG